MVVAVTLVASGAPGIAFAAADGQDATPGFTIDISPQEEQFYAREIGYLDVRITRDGAPAQDQEFRLEAQPLETMFTTPVVPIGGEFRVTGRDGRSRVPIEFESPVKHRVVVSIGHNILDSNRGASVTVFVERRWYRAPKNWLGGALAVVAVSGSVVWYRRRRNRG